MHTTGIQRKVDDLGRVVIPAGIRRALGIREGDALEVAVDGERVVLEKPSDHCVFCGGEEALEPYRNRQVCRSCVAAVSVLDDSLRVRRPQEPAPDAQLSPALPPWNLDRPVPTPQRPAPQAPPARVPVSAPAAAYAEPGVSASAPASTTAW